jgi:hypothetical protein
MDACLHDSGLLFSGAERSSRPDVFAHLLFSTACRFGFNFSKRDWRQGVLLVPLLHLIGQTVAGAESYYCQAITVGQFRPETFAGGSPLLKKTELLIRRAYRTQTTREKYYLSCRYYACLTKRHAQGTGALNDKGKAR